MLWLKALLNEIYAVTLTDLDDWDGWASLDLRPASLISFVACVYLCYTKIMHNMLKL
jgi:hypothetical protein